MPVPLLILLLLIEQMLLLAELARSDGVSTARGLTWRPGLPSRTFAIELVKVGLGGRYVVLIQRGRAAYMRVRSVTASIAEDSRCLLLPQWNVVQVIDEARAVLHDHALLSSLAKSLPLDRL